MIDAIVIGAGIIGATVAAALRKSSETLLLDDGRPNSGTVPSGGHLKPSWFGSMKKADYEPAMELLDQVWGLTTEAFRVWPTPLTTDVYRVDTDKVVAYPRTIARVTALKMLDNYPIVFYEKDGLIEEERCRLLVIATGAWAQELLPNVEIKAKQGVSFRVEGKLTEPLIKPWAPYKQIVAHQQRPNEVWIGDGTAVYPSNWKSDRTQACLARCLGATEGLGSVKRTLIGYRPYCLPENASEPCLLRRLGLRAWLATGAGKSGTIAAGWVARRVVNEAL